MCDGKNFQPVLCPVNLIRGILFLIVVLYLCLMTYRSKYVIFSYQHNKSMLSLT